MKSLCAFLSVCFLLLIQACTESPTDATPKGAFSYSSYDSLGTTVAKGWFTMIASDSGSISGEWHFTRVATSDAIGPQIGSGVLVGGISNGHTWLELNPSFADNNLQLVGTFDGISYSGQWYWTTYIGVTNHGTFEAHRQ